MPGQSVLVQISIIYCMIHMYVLLFLFYEYRCSRRTFIISGAAVICVTSGISLWIELTSALIDHAVGGGGVVTFVLRIVSIPLLEYAVYRWLRKPYLKMSHLVRKGWLLFAALTGTSYLILVLLSVYPTLILERPDDIPLTVVVLILIALAYATIFLVLFEQLHNLEAQERQRVLEAQTVMMSQWVEDILRAEATMQIERHDMRHRLQTVASLAQREDYAALLDYIDSSQEKLTAAEPKRYCSSPALDAVLVNAAAQADQLNINMEIKIGLPKELPVDMFELSIVFANALENAIQAVKKLPEDQRRIICKSVTHPRFMIEVSRLKTVGSSCKLRCNVVIGTFHEIHSELSIQHLGNRLEPSTSRFLPWREEQPSPPRSSTETCLPPRRALPDILAPEILPDLLQDL